MARKQAHEEHTNHEAWAIPYGDLVTLLLAFFVVMYAVSSVNEGKYRVLSDSMSEAFGGAPRSVKPIQLGKISKAGSQQPSADNMIKMGRPDQSIGGQSRDLKNPQVIAGKIDTKIPQHQVNESGNTGYKAERAKLESIATQVEKALGDLVSRNLVTVRRTETWVEIEIKTDILFPSGSARIDPKATPALKEIANIVQPYPNRVRIEGHTDNVPISTAQFPSNWELSSARAAGVLHILAAQGISEKRLQVLGMGEEYPKADNATPEGRNANRRVVLVLLAEPGTDKPDVTVGEVGGDGAGAGAATAEPAVDPIVTPRHEGAIVVGTPALDDAGAPPAGTH